MNTTQPGDSKITELINQAKSIPNFGTYSIVVGILLIILGVMGVLLPQMMSLEATVFIASLFIVGGIFWAIHSFKYSKKQWSEWLKPVLLLVSGGLMLFYPLTGVASIGLILAAYLMLDAYGNFTLAYGLHPKKGWGWMAFNGIISLALAIMFLIGWPTTSLWLVGLFIAISLFFDGWALLLIGWEQRKKNMTSPKDKAK